MTSRRGEKGGWPAGHLARCGSRPYPANQAFETDSVVQHTHSNSSALAPINSAPIPRSRTLKCERIYIERLRPLRDTRRKPDSKTSCLVNIPRSASPSMSVRPFIPKQVCPDTPPPPSEFDTVSTAKLMYRFRSPPFIRTRRLSSHPTPVVAVV